MPSVAGTGPLCLTPIGRTTARAIARSRRSQPAPPRRRARPCRIAPPPHPRPRPPARVARVPQQRPAPPAGPTCPAGPRRRACPRPLRRSSARTRGTLVPVTASGRSPSERREARSKDRRERVGRQHPAEQLSLGLVAPVRKDEVELRGRLHPFSDHAQVERVSKRDDRLSDHGVPSLLGDPPHDRSVDLQTVDGQPHDVVEVWIAHPELADRDLNADGLELVQDGDRLLPTRDEDALGEVELDAAGRKCRAPQGPLDGLGEPVAAKLWSRDVDCRAKRWQAGAVPVPDLAASPGKHELTERMDEVGILCDRQERGGRDPAPVAVPPARQHLDADDPSARDRGLRLEVDLQLLSSKREAQLVLELEAFCARGGHSRGAGRGSRSLARPAPRQRATAAGGGALSPAMRNGSGSAVGARACSDFGSASFAASRSPTSGLRVASPTPSVIRTSATHSASGGCSPRIGMPMIAVRTGTAEMNALVFPQPRTAMARFSAMNDTKPTSTPW